MGARERAKRRLGKLSRELESLGLKDELIDQFVDLIIQAAVDQVKAELSELVKEPVVIREEFPSGAYRDHRLPLIAEVFINKFIEKGVENDK